MSKQKTKILQFDTHGNDKQKSVVALWLDKITSDIVYGGSKGNGKSYLGVSLIFGDALIYPETHYFIARKSLTNLRKFTIPSIHEVFNHWEVGPEYWTYNGQDSYFKLYNGSKVYLLDATYLPSDPEYYRFGSMQMTRGWIEEAGEFEEPCKNNLAASIGRWKNDVYGLHPKLLQTCNPAKNYLYRQYYKPFRAGTLEPWRQFVQALPTDNKKLPAGYLENLERTLSKNERERLLLGNWEADTDPAALIDYEKGCDVFNNSHVPGGRKCITADIARLGGDRIVIIEWDGLRGKVSAYKREKLTVTTTNIDAARHRLGVGKMDVIVDSDGMGSGVEDFGGFKGFINNSRPMADPKKPTDANGKPIVENFDNLKSQCGFRMAELINSNQIYLEAPEEFQPLIIEEFEQVKQKALDSDLKKGLMPKDKIKEAIGRSPDFWDAILMRIYFELKPKFVMTADAI